MSLTLHLTNSLIMQDMISHFLSTALLFNRAERAYLEKWTLILTFAWFWNVFFTFFFLRRVEGVSRDLPQLTVFSGILSGTLQVFFSDYLNLRGGQMLFCATSQQHRKGSDKGHCPCFDCIVAKGLGWNQALFPPSSTTRQQCLNFGQVTQSLHIFILNSPMSLQYLVFQCLLMYVSSHNPKGREELLSLLTEKEAGGLAQSGLQHTMLIPGICGHVPK